MTIETWIVGWILSTLFFLRFYKTKGIEYSKITLIFVAVNFVAWPISVVLDVYNVFFKKWK